MDSQIIYVGTTWIAEISDGQSWTEVARGTAFSQEEAQQLGQEAVLVALNNGNALDELSAAKMWGRGIVRAFEVSALESGINASPVLALALDRYLREVSACLSAGRLHVAYAALNELLLQPEATRPVGASDSALVPIHDMLAARLELPLWPG